MIDPIHKKQSSIPYKILCGFIALTFLTSIILPPQIASAQFSPTTVLNLPVPGTMIPPSSGFAPALMTGITIHPDNPLRFDFIMDRGQSGLADEPLKEEYTKIIKYFMASLTVPEDELWVNLSPYEKDRMVAAGLGKTEMGRDMLAQDYLLKQLTASLMYPEKELGKKFWDRIYKKAKEQFGTTEIPVNTFNKVWIVPDEAVVYEQGASAFVIKSRLAVMLESDYQAQKLDSRSSIPDTRNPSSNEQPASSIETEIIREIIIPAIEKEINEGKNFANLRQIYNALILATWYKQRLKDSLLGKVYVDQNKTKGIDTEDKEVNQKIYDQYIESFKKGVYNFIKEDVDPVTREMVPRKYFSGGARLTSSPIKGDLKLQPMELTKKLGLGLGAVILAFGISSVTSVDIAIAKARAADGNEDVVPTAFVENEGSDARIVVGDGVTENGAAIVVNKGVQPALLVQAGKEPLGKKEAEIEKDVLSNLKKLANIDNPDKARQDPAFEAILALWSKAEPTLVKIIKEEQVFGMNELKYALLLLGMVGTPNDENEKLLRSFIKQDYKGNMGPPAIEAAHGLEILLRRKAREPVDLGKGDSKTQSHSKIDASFWQYPDDPMVQTVEVQPEDRTVKWSWYDNQPWVGWGMQVLMDPGARKKIAEKDISGLSWIMPYKPGSGDFTFIFEDNAQIKRTGDNWIGNEVRISEGELLKRARQKEGYLVVSLQKISEIIPVVFNLKQIKFEAVSREGTASIGQPLITGKNLAEITDIDTLYEALIKAELEPGKPSSQLVAVPQELWTPNMSWAGSDGFGQHFVVADLPHVVSTGKGQALELTYTSQGPNNLELYIFTPDASEGFKADLEGAAGTEKTVYVALPLEFNYQRVVLTGKDPGLAGISLKIAGESTASSPIIAVNKLLMGVLLSTCVGCSIGIQYKMDTPAFRQAMTSANETDLNQLLQQIRKTHKGFNFHASVTDAGLRRAVETFREDEKKVGFLGDNDFIEALSLLDNLSPETLKAVIPLIVNTQERLDPYLWAGKELARLTDDRRLAALAGVSTAVKLLVQEGDLIVPSRTIVDYRWTRENELERYQKYYEDHTEVNHPAPRWNDTDIPRLEKLSKGPYPYYQKAAEKALEKIKRGDLQVSPASSPIVLGLGDTVKDKRSSSDTVSDSGRVPDGTKIGTSIPPEEDFEGIEKFLVEKKARLLDINAEQIRVFARIRDAISQKYPIAPEKIDLASSLDDLVDSLEKTELALVLEDAFGIKILDEEAEGWEFVADIYATITAAPASLPTMGESSASVSLPITADGNEAQGWTDIRWDLFMERFQSLSEADRTALLRVLDQSDDKDFVRQAFDASLKALVKAVNKLSDQDSKDEQKGNDEIEVRVNVLYKAWKRAEKKLFFSEEWSSSAKPIENNAQLLVASGQDAKIKPGGIDLNPALLDLQIKRDGNGVPLPLPQQPIETMHIDGFLPVIINIVPITNLPFLLGLADTATDTQEARPASKAREIEPISLLN